MSWAAIALRAKDAPASFDKPKQVVVAPDVDVTDADRQHTNPLHHTARLQLPHFDKGLLVLDTNAFIKGMDNLASSADALLSIPEVINEIRDRTSKDLLGHLPRPLTVLDPTKEAIEEVMDCAGKTGDLGVMSRTDIRLCALALDACEVSGQRRAQIDPRPAAINPVTSANGGITVVTDAVSDNDDDEDEEDEEQEEGGDANEAEGSAQGASKTGEKDEYDDEDGEWITPENISKVINGTAKHNGQRYDGGVACVTSDYAMQNTLMHLGVPVVGTAGVLIKELRLWLLRCTACFAVTSDTTRQFCPDCGAGDTLRRVNYVIKENGEKSLFINFKKQISTRGTVYNLPKPRGGKRGTNKTLVLREDQLAHYARRGNDASQRAKEKIVHEDDELAAFGDAQKHKKRDVDQPRMTSSYRKHNVNEYRKARAGKKK